MMDVDCVNINRGEMLNNIWLVNISTGLFVVEFRGTSVGVTNWRERKDYLYGEKVRAKARRVRDSQWGSKDAEAN